MITQGSLGTSGIVMQSDRNIVVRVDGSASGSVTYECDKSSIPRLPKLYSPHPDDSSLVAHNIELTFAKLNKIRATYSYSGLAASYGSVGKSTVEMDGGCDQVPIQTHPDFIKFAGTASNPKNGAVWVDADSGRRTKKNENAEFQGFKVQPSSPFFGVETYIVPRPILTKSYWTKVAPSGNPIGKIVSKITGAPTPPGIKNWLCVGFTYQEAGGVFLVSEQYKGSPSPGWNTQIYS